MPLKNPMPAEHMHDLAIELQPDGYIRLEQEAGSLEGADTIILHPAQIRLIAERAGLLAPVGDVQAEKTILRLSRRLYALRDDIETLHRLLASVPCVPPGSVTEDVTAARHLLELAETYCEDIPEELSNENSSPPRNKKSSNENSNAAISVTHGRRGRPSTGQALTAAERQARHRAKQAELAPAGEEVVAEGATA